MRSEKHKNIDETGWKSFFRREGKQSFLDWMWVFGSSKVAFYVPDTSLSSSVLLKWLDKNATGVITSDRAHGYKKFAPWNIPPEVRDRYQMGGKELILFLFMSMPPFRNVKSLTDSTISSYRNQAGDVGIS